MNMQRNRINSASFIPYCLRWISNSWIPGLSFKNYRFLVELMSKTFAIYVRYVCLFGIFSITKCNLIEWLSLFYSFEQLHDLSICGNIDLDGSGLISLVSNTRHLMNLELEGSFSSTKIASLFEAISTNTSIKSLKIKINNTYTDDHISSVLIRCLKANKSILELHLTVHPPIHEAKNISSQLPSQMADVLEIYNSSITNLVIQVYINGQNERPCPDQLCYALFCNRAGRKILSEDCIMTSLWPKLFSRINIICLNEIENDRPSKALLHADAIYHLLRNSNLLSSLGANI